MNLDADTWNADWTKETWDLPTDMRVLRAWLRQNGFTVARFKRLPVHRMNVDKVPGLRDL